MSVAGVVVTAEMEDFFVVAKRHPLLSGSAVSRCDLVGTGIV